MKICRSWANSLLENFRSGHGSVFWFVLFFVGYPGDCVHSVCSAGFFFRVHFWTAISCAERGSQNCPKLIGGLRGVLWHKANWEISETALKRVSSRITHLFLLLSCPISSTISPDSYQHWYFDCDFDCVKISFSENLRYPYWAKAWPLLCLNTFVTSGHNKDVTHHTRV